MSCFLAFQVSDELLLPCKNFFLSEYTHKKGGIERKRELSYDHLSMLCHFFSFQMSDEFLPPCKHFFIEENIHKLGKLGEDVSFCRKISQYYAIF